MGRQVTFRAAPQDIDELERHLVEKGAVFVAWRSDSAEIEPRGSLRALNGVPGTPWIVREQDVAKCRRSFVEAQGYWLVDRDSCHMVDWFPGTLDQRPATHGRLHFETSVKRGESWVSAPDDFVRWADGILRWVRRKFIYSAAEDVYYGPEAARLRGSAADAPTRSQGSTRPNTA